MAEPFVGEITMFAGNFAPRGWAFCDGQLLPIAQNTALFSLLGTIYGGDGRTTTALPNLQGRLPMHPGDGPGLTDRRLGQHGGVEQITLTTEQIPQHSHRISVNVSTGVGGESSPDQNFLASNSEAYAEEVTNGTSLAGVSLENAGGSQAHNNMAPFGVINMIIALVGLYPSRD